MKRIKPRKLSFTPETIQNLTAVQLAGVVGGADGTMGPACRTSSLFSQGGQGLTYAACVTRCANGQCESIGCEV